MRICGSCFSPNPNLNMSSAAFRNLFEPSPTPRHFEKILIKVYYIFDTDQIELHGVWSGAKLLVMLWQPCKYIEAQKFARNAPIVKIPCITVMAMIYFIVDTPPYLLKRVVNHTALRACVIERANSQDSAEMLIKRRLIKILRWTHILPIATIIALYASSLNPG